MRIKERELTRSSGKIYTIRNGTYTGVWYGHRVDVNCGRENCWFRTKHKTKREVQVLIEVNGCTATVYEINNHFKRNHLFL